MAYLKQVTRTYDHLDILGLEMDQANFEPVASRRGNPSYLWRFGQERRLDFIRPFLYKPDDLILDLGCGVGEYVRAIKLTGAECVGIDIERPRLLDATARDKLVDASDFTPASYLLAASEALPFEGESFDVVLMNEVIEHVQDDKETLREIYKILKPGGVCILFAPNKGYPFETHGIWWRNKYIFGNIPVVNWLPARLRNKLVPHARVYGHLEFESLIQNLSFTILRHSYVFPGFDNIYRRSKALANVLRFVCYRLERTPLCRLGLSHFMVLQKAPKQ